MIPRNVVTIVATAPAAGIGRVVGRVRGEVVSIIEKVIPGVTTNLNIDPWCNYCANGEWTEKSRATPQI